MKHFSIKNLILWVVFYTNLCSFVLSVCCLDSDYYMFFGTVALVNLCYMVLFYIANYERFDKWIKGVKK